MSEGKTRANAVVTVEVAGDAIVFNVKGAGTTTLHLAQLGEKVKAQALIHGLVQRVSDRAAISRNPENGQPATPQDKLARMAALVEHYNAGSEEWSPGRVAGGGKKAAHNPVLEAVALIQGVSYSEMAERVKAACEKRGVGQRAYLAKLATQPAVMAKMAELAAQGGVAEGDDLMDELMGD